MNLLPHLQDSPEQDPDLPRADPESCEEPATTTDIPAEPSHLASPIATDPRSPTAITPPTTPEIPTADNLRLSSPSDSTIPAINLHDTLPTGNTRLLQAFHEKWSGILETDSTWDVFSAHCTSFAAEAKTLASTLYATSASRPGPRVPNRPPGRRPPHGGPHTRFNAAEAQRLQSFYRHSKKRAIRKILDDDSPNFSGPANAAETFFKNIFAAKPCDIAALKHSLNNVVPSVECDESLFRAPSAQEIRQKLRSAANTSPGPDRVEYRHLKRVDPHCKIFARCVESRDVPSEWKTAVTILLHKKGPTDDASNFRPIALMSCIYKLLMSVLAKRLSSWAIDNELLSPEQKSARPSEGCYEHTYLLSSVVADTRRQTKKLNLAWLDLRNAFGSIPHSVIHTTLTHMGAPPNLVEFVSNAYTGATTTIRTSTGDTNAVPIHAGVKQGCPLSPFLFNLCIELIIRSVKTAGEACRGGAPKHFQSPLSVLAYADDLVFITRKKENMDNLLNAATTSANILGLSFRPDKCATLTLHDGSHAVNTAFHIQGQAIPVMSAEDTYRYLGVPIGLIHNVNDLPAMLPKLIQDLGKISDSPLAPWQKLDAIRTFIQPCLTFSLRAGHPLKRSMELYRTTLVRGLRQICALPNLRCIFLRQQVFWGTGFPRPTQRN